MINSCHKLESLKSEPSSLRLRSSPKRFSVLRLSDLERGGGGEDDASLGSLELD